MNNNAIINIVKKLTEINGPPCKKTLQKIVFLIEAKKNDLGFDYGIHFYGPYSSDLDFAVRQLNEEGFLNIEYTPMGHKISVANVDNINELSDDDEINEVISNFAKQTPRELELLATALYVFLQVNDNEKILPAVKKLKGSKYSDQQIETAISRLKSTGYLTK